MIHLRMRPQLSMSLVFALAIFAASCAAPAKPQASLPPPPAPPPSGPGSASCVAMKGRALPASAMTLPTSGATITAADYTGDAYCKVIAEIKPIDPSAPPIRVQLNLPTAWNSKALQCGGGGLNGTLVTCETGLRDAPAGPTPLARGYMTFGTDAGHQNTRDKDVQTFALNDEALINHAYASYKKTYDLARTVVADYYKRQPTRIYFFGGSEGGREAMSAVQRYPDDYDGVVGTVPVLSWTGVNIAGYQQHLVMRDGGWMSSAKVALVQKATLAACDKQDGIADGVIARYAGCDAAKAVKALRCAGGVDSGETCLSDKQIKLVQTVRARTPYGFTLNNGEADFPGYATGGEALPGNFIPTIVPAEKPSPQDMSRNVYAVGDVRYFILKDPTFLGPVDWKKYEARTKQISALMDMNDPDLSRFKARGGKLIIKSNGADFLVAPQSVWRYYENVVAKMGQASVDEFTRLYVAPWTGHGGSGIRGDGKPVPDKVDLLSMLEAWVERGEAPASQLTLTSYAAGAPVASWPMCRYPNYPHYKGAGDANAAASYECKAGPRR